VTLRATLLRSDKPNNFYLYEMDFLEACALVHLFD